MRIPTKKPPLLPSPSSPPQGQPLVEAKAGPTPTKFTDRSKEIWRSKELQMPPSDSAPAPQLYKLAGGG